VWTLGGDQSIGLKQGVELPPNLYGTVLCQCRNGAVPDLTRQHGNGLVVISIKPVIAMVCWCWGQQELAPAGP